MGPSKFDRQIWPAVVAHRGASSTHPENTLPAFLAAAEAGADFIELDVRMTADGVPVVLHDIDLSRTTDGAGAVSRTSLSDLRRLDASRGVGERTPIPTFAEALEALSGRAGLDVEIKNLPEEQSFDSPREEAVEATLALAVTQGFPGPLVITSFNWLSIERAKQIDPTVPTGFITSALIDPWAALVYARNMGHDLVLPQAPALYEAGLAFVEAAHGDGIRVGAWTVDDPDAVERLFDMGVDAVATNDPAMAVPIRNRFRP